MSSTNWEALKKPFDESEVSWKPGGNAREQNGGFVMLAMAHIDARAVMDRLDEVVGPENWKDEYAAAPLGGVQCTLSIRVDGEWIGKTDVGTNSDYEAEKGGYSDALKRAAVKWGIGRYLYGLPAVWHPCKENLGKNGKKTTYTFIGTPKMPARKGQSGSGKSEQKPERPARPKSQATAPGKKAQGGPPAANGNGSTKIERPMSAAQVIDALQRKAISQDKPADKVVISAGQARALAIRMGEYMDDFTRKYVLKQAFKVDTSKELTNGEMSAVMQWLPPASEVSEPVKAYIEGEVAALAAERMATEQAQAE